MSPRLIRFCYRKIIDTSSQKLWDKYVFDDTYQEFYMQAQFFNQESQYTTFQELLQHVPGADRLHYLTSTAAIGYIRQLDGIVPEVANQLGKLCLPFTQFKFEIIQSHVSQKDQHRVAILFFSEPITWLDTIGTHLLVAYGDQRDVLAQGNPVETDLIAIQPYLSLSSVQIPAFPA